MKITLIAASVALLAACGQRVEVPPAHVGKIMTKDGYQENLIPTSKFRLEQCMTYCDRLVVMDIADKAYSENLNIFIPEDQLNLGVTVQATLSINPKKTEELFKAISPKEENDHLSVIENQRIYQTYASQIIQKEVREYLSKFSISQIASSNEKINAEISAKLSDVIGSRTPFNVRFIGITGLKYPEIITKAQEAAAERREAIQQEEAQAKVTEVKLSAQLQEARLQRAIEKEKAETEALAQRVLAESVDPRVIKLRQLEIEKIKAERWNGQLPVFGGGGSGGQSPVLFNIPAAAISEAIADGRPAPAPAKPAGK
jgi:regulator of protease activity HflC (stomatin/prohibitin superfamily)